MTISADPIDVPYTSLTHDTLRAVIEEFVTRSGTDYGEHERTLEQKVADILRQFRCGEAKLVFDPRTASVNIVAAHP